ncbi:excalibur calcium-binding domain-containing protein [Streptococcus suis]|nr:excalibur calcium-binding domain-containing protein [Streptococcus suis]
MFNRWSNQSNHSESIPRIKKIFNRKTAIAVGGLGITTVVGSQLMTAELPMKNQIYDKSIEVVLKQFEEAGFEKVETIKISNIEYGENIDDTFVKVVSVDGEDWKEGRVLKSTPVSITYHGASDDAVELAFSSKKLSEIEEKLDNAGFENVSKSPILLVEKGNIDKKDTVDKIEIGSSTYTSGYFYSKRLPITITYFDVSPDNIEFPTTLDTTGNRKELETQLTTAGFSNVKWTAVADKDKTKHEKISKITINGKSIENLSNIETVVKKQIPIEVTYSDFSSFAELPVSLTTTTVADTKQLFTNNGFEQVSETSIETNEIGKNGQIQSVEIDGKNFNEINDKVIRKDSKIVIKYWNAEMAIAEKARKEEEARLAAEAQKVAQAQSQAQNQAQIQQFAGTSAGTVYYKNCTAARNAGAAPVRIGDPGYAPHLDRDGDGIGCE